MLQEGTELRLNRFQATADDGFTTPFSPYDYYYTEQSTCTRTSPGVCEPLSQQSSTSPVTGGDIFLIILFSVIAVYLIAATSYGY